MSVPNWSLLEEVTPSTVILPFVPSPMVRLPAVIFPNSVSLRLMLPVVPNPIVVPDWEARIVVPAVPLFKVELKAKSTAVIDSVLFPVLNAPASVKVPVELSSESASIVEAPAEVKVLLIAIPSVAFNVIAPGVEIPPVAFNVREPAETVPAEIVLLLMTNPVDPVNVNPPCPVMVPPLWPMVSVPAELLKLLPAEKVMLPFTRLMSPVPRMLDCSVPSRVIPKPDKLFPIPNEPPSETLIVVEPVPLLRDPVKVISFAVTVNALLVVDKDPDEMVKSPAPLSSRSASIDTAPLTAKFDPRVIPELALRVADPAED